MSIRKEVYTVRAFSAGVAFSKKNPNFDAFSVGMAAAYHAYNAPPEHEREVVQSFVKGAYRK